MKRYPVKGFYRDNGQRCRWAKQEKHDKDRQEEEQLEEEEDGEREMTDSSDNVDMSEVTEKILRTKGIPNENPVPSISLTNLRSQRSLDLFRQKSDSSQPSSQGSFNFDFNDDNSPLGKMRSKGENIIHFPLSSSIFPPFKCPEFREISKGG